MQCAVGTSTFQYAFVGSNPYYVKLQITNTRWGLAALVLLSLWGGMLLCMCHACIPTQKVQAPAQSYSGLD